MKKMLATLLAVFTLLTCGFFSDCSAEKTQPDTDAVWETVGEAYIYAFPLVLTDATKTLSTNTDGTVASRAPVNQFNHAKKLADASFRTVVTPNVDTVYSQAWLDIGAEPMIYVLPETDRFCNVQILDAWTNTAAVLDTAGAYAIALPDWEGELPDGVTRVDVPTATVWSIARVVLSGDEDLPHVYAIQDQMQLLPLSAYGEEGRYTAPQGRYAKENDFVPIDKVLSMTPDEFFNTANRLMQVNPPADADEELLKKLSAVNVGAGMTFDAALLGEDAAERWKKMLQGLRATLAADGAKYAQKLGQWRYYGKPIGDFGTEYTYRAMVALVGLGANTVDVAIYPKTAVDEIGAALNGEKTYTLHFASLPPTLEGGFWSVTAYGEDDFLIDNPIHRFCINDRSAFDLNEDGTLDIVLSKNAPENTANWLPVSDGGFHLFMRIYVPDMDALETWQPPVIREQ
ncbi:DUF1254 domain-containing protein [Selenomonas sp.]|uniref:DUF1254 domain-containing protein n=1 Tax=Selenomonas sp. TaxID=2053611 RepID=UPI003FA33285